jgi:hypothetical protein
VARFLALIGPQSRVPDVAPSVSVRGPDPRGVFPEAVRVHELEPSSVGARRVLGERCVVAWRTVTEVGEAEGVAAGAGGGAVVIGVGGAGAAAGGESVVGDPGGATGTVRRLGDELAAAVDAEAADASLVAYGGARPAALARAMRGQGTAGPGAAAAGPGPAAAFERVAWRVMRVPSAADEARAMVEVWLVPQAVPEDGSGPGTGGR